MSEGGGKGAPGNWLMDGGGEGSGKRGGDVVSIEIRNGLRVLELDD